MNMGIFNILIIEDSPDDSELYSRFLRKIFNCNINICRMAEHAMHSLQQEQYDIILLDYHLPSTNGVDFIRTVNQMDLGLMCPIIALTGQGNEKVAVEFMRLGVADYIKKEDVSLESLSHVIHRALDNFHIKLIEYEKKQESMRFAHTIVHDLQSPLGRVAAYTKLLAKNNAVAEKKYILNIQEDVQYIAEFLNNLLLYAELGRTPLEKAEVDLNSVLRKTVHNLELEISAREVKLQVSADLPKILGNKISLIQLFQNLIANSIKYCVKRPVISVSAKVQDNHVIVAVADNGIGIKKQENEEAFKPFTRIQNQLDTPGLGLGLALCQTIAKQHNAVIEFDSCIAEGTNTFITFPLYNNESNNYIG